MITVLKGDASRPTTDAQTIVIPHIVNNIGAWGAGFVLSLSKNVGSIPEMAYKSRIKSWVGRDPWGLLGNTQFVRVDVGGKVIIVANMFAQDGVGHDSNGKPPIRYGALGKSMTEVANIAIDPALYGIPRHSIPNYSFASLEIHCPWFGCGLAGGRKDVIESMMEELWSTINLKVTVWEP